MPSLLMVQLQDATAAAMAALLVTCAAMFRFEACELPW
jgi:hypothetical protein